MLFSLPDFTFLQGTISDQTGAFNIKSNETKGVLPISSVGYSTILLPCTSSNMGTIQLYSDAQLLYSRPYYAQLRSNVMYINRYTYEGGNPFLLPSLSHNITLGTTYKWVYLSAGYQYVKFAYVDIIGYQLFVVNTVEKWMCFLLAYGRKPRFNVFNLILQEKCEFEVAK